MELICSWVLPCRVLEWQAHKMPVSKRQSSPCSYQPLTSFYFPHSHPGHQIPFYFKQKLSKLLNKKDKVGLPPPTVLQTILLDLERIKGQGQTIGKTHSLNLRPQSLAPPHPGGSTGIPGKGDSCVLGHMLGHPSRVHFSSLGP